MARVQLLAAELIDQIAAGEVVERPASVVKELVENALDAGARRIDVELEGGGQQLVRVVDDGAGMPRDDVELALLRHATSKITRLDDLFALATMGFRGEALPSIASVARLTITSRTTSDVAAWRVALEGGTVSERREAGAPVGTTVEVRDLFFNVPARRKFLKAEATETAHASEAVLRLALARPDVHFRLRVLPSSRVLLDLPPHASLVERAAVALGRARSPAHLHKVTGRENGVTVEGGLGSPADAATTARSSYVVVNGRYVRDRGLLHAIHMGYGETLERGRYPLAVVHVSVPPAELDVNVHPQKVEVRFAKAAQVYDAVRHIVAAACANAPWLDAPPPERERALRVYSLPPTPTTPARETPRYTDRAGIEAALDLFKSEGARPAIVSDKMGAPSPVEAQSDDKPRGFFANLVYLGQLHRTYLLCQAPSELVLIDQHAAHERVAFERLRAAHSQRQMGTQRLLFPCTVELVPMLAAVAEMELGTLATLGFEIEHFGGASFAIKAVPEALGEDARVEEVLVDILERMAVRGGEQHTGSTGGGADALEHVLATMACHSVVRAGDVLDAARARALLDQMDGIDYRAHCPHGRPVLLRMSLGEIERRFGRT